MNEIYEKNMELLKENYMDICEKINELPESNRVITDLSVNGENIIGVYNENGRLFYLNSRYNDDEFTAQWAEQYRKDNFQNVFVIFGVSNFRHIYKLMEITDETNAILVYEPDIEIFYKSIQVNDISEILLSKRVLLCVRGVNDNYFEEFILFALTYQTINITQYCCMYNYDILYMKEWRDVVRSIKDRCESVIMTRNTVLLFSGEFVVNYLANCRDFISQYSLNQLRDVIIGNNINEVPAIIVSAGPSLDKNIEVLKLAENKAMIIAVDTSLKSLLNHGIIPDIVVTVDSHKPPILFMHTKFKDIAMLVCSQSNKELLPICTGKRFYFDENTSYMSGLYKDITGEKLQITESGGSVANNAFSMANVLGFKDIILVGQDLAYTGKKMHASAAYGITDQDEVKEEGKYFEVEDIYGDKVLTEPNMDLYRKWFESQILRYNYLNVIDATEGGAKINGTQIMSLREAIELKCKKNVNIKELIKNIPPQFNKEEQQKLIDKIDHLADELEMIEKKIKKGIRYYEKIEELSRKNKTHTKEFKDTVKKIGEMSEFLEESPELSMAALYNQETSYYILGTVYNVKEDKRDEIRDISDNGIKMLNSYIDAIHSFIKDMKNQKLVSKEEFTENISKLNETIDIIIKKCNNNEFDKIDVYMKEFYNYFIKLVNKIQAIEESDNVARIYHDDYEELLEKLSKVVESNEDKDYIRMAEIMSEINQCIAVIGEKYNGL